MLKIPPPPEEVILNSEIIQFYAIKKLWDQYQENSFSEVTHKAKKKETGK